MAHTSDTQTPDQQIAAMSDRLNLMLSQTETYETREAIGRAITILDEEHDRLVGEAAEAAEGCS
jgi:hypothetical protein